MRLLMLSARLGGFQVILPCPVFLKNHYKLPLHAHKSPTCTENMPASSTSISTFHRMLYLKLYSFWNAILNVQILIYKFFLLNVSKENINFGAYFANDGQALSRSYPLGARSNWRSLMSYRLLIRLLLLSWFNQMDLGWK